MPHCSPLRAKPKIDPCPKTGLRGRPVAFCARPAVALAACLIGSLMMTTMPIPALGQPLAPVVTELLEAIRGNEAENGRIPSHAVLSGTLERGESASVQLHTCAGIEYRAVGLCDLGCTDFDLTAYESSAAVLDSDVLTDDVPVLFFTPAESGMTTLAVEMVSCAGSCDWGVQLFIDDTTAPAVPGSGDGGASTWSPDWDRYVGTYRGPGGDTTILLHENRLMILFPLSQQQNGAIGVLRPTGSTHVFRLESDRSSADGERVRFVLNDAGEVTAVLVAGRESRRVR